MLAISVRPPQGNAIAYWGRRHLIRSELKEDLPFPHMLGSQLAIHQGKRWDDTAREQASRYSSMLTDYRVALAPEGYSQGVVCVATLAAILDFTDTAKPGTHGRITAVRTPFVIERDPASATLVGNDEVAEITEHEVRTCVLVADAHAFDSMEAATAFAAEAVSEVARWGDSLDGVVWVLRDLIKFPNETACKGRSGVFTLPGPVAGAVRSKMRDARSG